MQKIKRLLGCALLSVSSLHSITPYYNIRSQSVNLPRELAGWTNFINLHNQQQVYGTLDGIVEYQQSFNSNSMIKTLFGNDILCNVCGSRPGIVISGSQTNNRGSQDWLADYFGLPTDFISRVTFEPVIKNIIFDLDFYIGLDPWAEGLYFTVRAPITQTKWHMDMCETISAIGNNDYAAGYFSANAEPGTLDSFTQFITGNAPKFAASSVSTGDTFPATVYQPLTHAKISCKPLVRTALAELQVAVGWNYCKTDWHVGLSGRLRAPTGLHPEGKFAFEPMVGNSHHWEFGGGLSGHWDFWKNACDTAHAGLFIDAIVTHMFTASQRRTFDLVGKPNSRYMLAQRLGSTRLDPSLADTFPDIEFQSEVTPVANLTTIKADVTIPVQGELVIMANYTHKNVSFDFGYNFWGRACEDIKIKTNGCSSPLSSQDWALKGDAYVIGFENGTFDPVRLAATESEATIHAGTNFPISGTTNSATITTGMANPGIDAPALALSSNSNSVLSQPSASLQTRSSSEPASITFKDLDVNGAATKGISHKLFTHVEYIWWHTCSHWVPYLGLAAEVEFGNKGNSSTGNCSSSSSCAQPSLISSGGQASSCSDSCRHCNDCAVSQWGIWLKGGIAF